MEETDEIQPVDSEEVEVKPEFYSEFKKPPASLKESEEMVENLIERTKRRKVTLTADEQDALKLELQREVQSWEDSRSGLETKLRDLNDRAESVTYQTDFPWPGANSTTLSLEKIKMREVTSVISRTAIRPIPFAVASYAGPASLYTESKDFVKDLESFTEDKLKNDSNVFEMIEMSPAVIFRDGTAPLQIMWETEYEHVSDWKLYKQATDFATDYPDSDSAGILKKEYRKILDTLTQGKAWEIRYEYDVPTYDAPKAYLVPLIDTFHYPVYVAEMKDMLTYGKRIWYTDYQLKMKAKMGFFDEDVIEAITASASDQRRDSLTTSRDRIEGINRDIQSKNSHEYEVFELVHKGPVTEEDQKNGVYRKYIIYYYRKTQQILRVEHYPIRKGKINYFPLRFIKRDGRFLGISLMDDIGDLSLDADIQNRQIINSRTITHVPSFKAKMSSKNTFDPSRREFRFRPGVVFYLADPDNDVRQFDIRPVDLSGSMDNILFYMQMIDMICGSTSGFSGQSNPIDPRAPARKQQELLRQASNRLDDYVKNLLPEFSDICEFVVDLYYQFAPERIRYYATTKDGVLVEKEMERTKLFSPNAKFNINGTSVFMNADIEYDRTLEINQMLNTSPLTAQIPRILRASLERVILASRVPGRQDLIPTDAEVPQALTNSQQLDIESSQALTREKMQARALGDQAKRDHEKEMALIQAQSTITAGQGQQQSDTALAQAQQQHEKESQLIDAAANPPAPIGAVPPAPTSTPGVQ